MDIAKYIGLFLLKNKYCCLQGLGNLDIKRKPAATNGGTLNGSSYEAILTTTGSIDDALANFIATNESVSIAKASNEISEFIAYAKRELAVGNDVIIPSVGKYVAQNNRIHFELDPAFSLPNQPVAIPVAVPQPVPEVTSAHNTYHERDGHSGNKLNWSLIAMWSVILIVVALAAIFGIRYFNNKPKDVVPVNTPIVPPPVVAKDTVVKTPAVDTVAKAPAVADTPEYNFIISSYKTLIAAQKREKQLTGYGHKVNVMTKDSLTFYVVKPMKLLASDTTKIKDSLSKVLNPKGVSILQ